MRGYFGVGVEHISKSMNVGSIFRSAHAFGASFVFTVAATYERHEGVKSDTSNAPRHVPFYSFPDVESLVLPQKCSLVGVELMDEAIDLPSFHHPMNAAYIMGPERASLSPAMIERCDHIIKIPTSFCVNVGIAAAIVMYDRVLSTQRFARRATRPGGPTEQLQEHVFGDPLFRKNIAHFLDQPPLDDTYKDK